MLPGPLGRSPPPPVRVRVPPQLPIERGQPGRATQGDDKRGGIGGQEGGAR